MMHKHIKDTGGNHHLVFDAEAEQKKHVTTKPTPLISANKPAEQQLPEVCAFGMYDVRHVCFLYLLQDGRVHIREGNWIIISFIVHPQICQTINGHHASV